MSQNPLIPLGSQFSKTPSLKPPLAAALASLEVQLDRELARYRRTRTGGYRASSQSSKERNSSSIGLQYLTPVTEATPSDTALLNSDENSNEIPISDTNVTPVTYKNEITTTPPPPPPPPPSPKVVVTPEPASETATSPLSSSASIVPVTTIKAETDQNVIDSTHQNQPDDYLESSEALLRSLTEEAPSSSQKRPKINNDSLLSPLGIGSILLFLMASVILGSVILNPKLLPQFNLDGLFKRNGTVANTDTGSPSSDGNTKTVAQPQLTPIPRYPNLAKDEFPEVKTPNDVVGLTPKTKSTSTPQNVVPQTAPQNVAPPVVPAISAPPTSPVAITPSPTPTKISASELKPSSDGFYHVVIDNNSQNAFASARKVVPDAYLSPDGKLIYLGAIKNKDKVQELLNDVKQKGLNARVK